MNRSLFVKHKLLFSFILLIVSLKINGLVRPEDYSFLLTNTSGRPSAAVALPEKLFGAVQWESILQLSNLESFGGMADEIAKDPLVWRKFFVELKKGTLPAFPGKFKTLHAFNTLMVVKLVYPELFVSKVQLVIRQELGAEFVEGQIISIEDSFQESSVWTPLIFILSPGDDPQEELKKFALEKGKFITYVSLGKGQGAFAEATIQETLQVGQWCLLQNCHLSTSWLPRLEEIIEEI